MSLGDLIEGIVPHSFEGRAPFDDQSLTFSGQMRSLWTLDLTATDSHMLTKQIVFRCSMSKRLRRFS